MWLLGIGVTDQPESAELTADRKADQSLRRAEATLARWRASSVVAQWRSNAYRVQNRAQKIVRRSASRGKTALKRSGVSAITHVSPRAANFLRKLRARSGVAALDRDWRQFLKTVHRSVFDRKFDALFFAKTAPVALLRRLHVASINRLSGSDYKATPTLVFAWAMRALDDDLRNFTFIDYGAGRGRVLMLASEYDFKRVIGIEFASELHDDAIMNIQQFPRSRMKCRDVECILDDVVRFVPPDEPSVYYFFNPFGPAILQDAIDKIVQSYRAHPRRLYLVLVDPVLADIVGDSGIFRPLPLPPRERTRLNLFSPYRVAVYRSVV